ncbi:MAG: hypothetical protein P4L81_05170 [Candidatus Pacebacteria bacterium]|nr:hypothetical protein [Candidatus Paceibacterota bacterium]
MTDEQHDLDAQDAEAILARKEDFLRVNSQIDEAIQDGQRKLAALREYFATTGESPEAFASSAKKIQAEIAQRLQAIETQATKLR